MFEWKEEYTTGMKEIDEQHKILFKCFNELEAVVVAGQRNDEKVIAIMEFLDSFCHFHFGFEEICMAERKCSSESENKGAHEAFLKLIDTYKEKIKKEGATEDIVEDIYISMLTWLRNHIIKIDQRFLECPNPPVVPDVLKD